MSSNIASSSNNQPYDPTALPSRWLDCPRISTIICDKFIACKTPLDSRYKEKIDISKRWTCSMLIDAVKREKKTLGLVIDLTYTDRFYNSETEFKQKNVRYEKIRCRGHGETPNAEQIKAFIDVCNEFSKTNSEAIIAVHCTHGFNRTGFLICAYLYREYDTSIDAAIDVFAKARPPGIYKQDYLNELLKLYNSEGDISMSAPVRPDWCLTNSDDEDEPNDRPVNSAGTKRKLSNNFQPMNKRFQEQTPAKSNPQFATNLPGVVPITAQQQMLEIQLKCQRMCEWERRDFPGSQPISMDHTNYMSIVESPYMVSWKADGTRYMMLIEDENKIYMFDRDNSVFHIHNLRFPKDPDFTRHLRNTLVDGELVMDKDNERFIPRYLIYDIITYENENVVRKPLKERLSIIQRSIIGVRAEAANKGHLDKSLEPFSVREKPFWDLSNVPKLLAPKFRSQIAHEVDGLIFQPELDPYTPGRSPRVLKWKEDNTIDFLLKIVTEQRMGQLKEKKAFLFVNGLRGPFARMRYTANLRPYDNKIIECSYNNGEWHFLRERTDKSFPNAKDTAYGAVTAIKNPVTREILCKIIDEHGKTKNH